MSDKNIPYETALRNLLDAARTFIRAYNTEERRGRMGNHDLLLDHCCEVMVSGTDAMHDFALARYNLKNA